MFGLFDKAEVTIKLPKHTVMEDNVQCVVEVLPKSDANLRKIEIELFCQETAVSRGTTDSYYNKKIFSDIRVPKKNFEIRRGMSLKFMEDFKLPEFSTPTMEAENHWVKWLLRVRLDVPLWPDTREELELIVLPFLVVPDCEHYKPG